MKQSKTIAMCGVMAALSVIVMLLGAALGLGMYLSPMIAGICLIPVGGKYGKKYHVILWLAVSLLSFMLVPNMEENLMFLCLFGCYPIIRPYFQKLPSILKTAVKLLYFNVVFIGLEVLILTVLVPETIGTIMMIILIVLGNLTFVCYDFVLPHMERLLAKYLGKIMNARG